jgi:hypothetical protein
MTIFQRFKAPTPPFFKKVRQVGVTLAAVSAAVLTTPVALPATVVTIAGYIAVAGAVAVAISQAATGDDEPQNPSHGSTVTGFF